MKNLFSLILLIGIAAAAYSQCTIPIAMSDLNSIKFEMSRAINPLMKLNIAQERSRSNCFYSYQVKEILVVLDNDNDKFNFAKNVYARVLDKENFYDIYDVFASPANMFRLYDFVRAQSSTITAPPSSTPVPISPINFPDARFYSGSKGCPNPMNNLEFQNIINTIETQRVDIARYTTAKAILNGKCITVEQLMRSCILIESDAYRLDILKTYIGACYDRGNFNYGAQLLNMEVNRNDYMNYCYGLSSVGTPPVVIDSFSTCRVSDAEFTNMQNSIKNLSFSNAQVSQIKTIMNIRCFTCSQIKSLCNLLDFESARLDIAKYAYNKCIDKNNYYDINSVFSFSSSITELNNYINTR